MAKSVAAQGLGRVSDCPNISQRAPSICQQDSRPTTQHAHNPVSNAAMKASLISMSVIREALELNELYTADTDMGEDRWERNKGLGTWLPARPPNFQLVLLQTSVPLSVWHMPGAFLCQHTNTWAPEQGHLPMPAYRQNGPASTRDCKYVNTRIRASV